MQILHIAMHSAVESETDGEDLARDHSDQHHRHGIVRSAPDELAVVACKTCVTHSQV